MLTNALAQFLTEKVNSSKGRFTEIIIMGKRGLAIAVSPKTTDLWQGDEAKWQQTYPKGKAGFYADSYKLDESTQTKGIQISRTLLFDGEPVGAITVGVDIVYRAADATPAK